MDFLKHFVNNGYLQVHRDVTVSQRAAFAPGTFANNIIQWKTYFMFCAYFNLMPLPASIEVICAFAQFLSRTFQTGWS